MISINLVTAFLAGIVSFLSPCVLPLVPGYVSYVTGKSLAEIKDSKSYWKRFNVLWLSLNFVLGFSIVFISLGATATVFGKTLLAYRYEAGILAGAVIFAFGLHMLGVFQISWLNRDWRIQGKIPKGTPFGALGLGMAFAFGWTPCIGPILGTILAMSASIADVQQGVILLSTYSAGLAIPFLAVAAFTSIFLTHMRGFGKGGRYLHLASGGVLALVGIALMTGTLSRMGTWLLITFPFMQELII